MTKTTCSVFLCPVEEDAAWTTEIIRTLAARFGAPLFEPHVTIYSGRGEIEELREVLASELGGAPPFRLRVRRVGATAEFFRTLFQEFEETPRLRSLHDALGKVMERDDGKPFEPHLSLLYREMPLEEKLILTKEIVPQRRELAFDSVKVTALQDPVKGWRDFQGWKTVWATRIG